MCARYRLLRYQMIRAMFEAVRAVTFEEFSETKVRWWNICPSNQVPVVRLDDTGQREIVKMQWGFVPSWAKDAPKIRPVNAKAETVATNGMFRQAFASHRCLIPADGFYEWKGIKPPKKPHFIHRKDDGLFAFAGIWERWREADTFAMLTTTPNELMAPIHNRMPVIIEPKNYGRWLDPETPVELLAQMMKPSLPETMEAYAVGTAVNSPANDGPNLISASSALPENADGLFGPLSN
jgi:putative SOS response-associated peptidase YedK